MANGELRVSLLFEANHGAAKAAVVEMQGATDDLNAAMREAGGAAGTAADGAAEWGSVVQMLRAQLQPMVAEADALSAGMQQLAVAEEMGALTAREAVLAHDLLSRQMIDLQARMDAAGVTMDGTTASVIRHDTALQQLINGSAGVGAATDRNIAETLRHGQALDQLRAQFDPLFAASRQYELQLAAIEDAERQGAISAQVAEQARARAAASMGAMDDVIRQQAAAQREAEVAAQAHAARLADLQSRYSPLVAQSKQYELALREIAEAEGMGAISAREATLAHDQLSEKMADLQVRMDAAGVTLDGTTASVMRHDTALQQLINGSAGVSRAEGQSIADHLRHGQALDQLRARFDPVFAAQRQYELLLLDIADAERQGAITAQIAGEARTRASQALATASVQVTQMGASSGAAASYVANLGYQLNDIGMMLSMGQSPFMLMMQQGPQVVQVFGQMRAAGMQIGPAIASAFTSILNPLSFATMAVIGFGAAALQWFTGAGEKAKSLEDAISELESRVRSYRSAVDDVLTPMGELRKEWGAQAGEIRELSQAMMLLERVRALKALSEGVASIRSEFSGLKGDLETIANMEASVASARQAVDLGVRGPEAVINALEQQKGIIEGIREEYGLTVDQAKQLQAALDGLGAAKGPQETSAALGQVREVLTAILSRGGEFPASFLAAAEQILGAEEAARLLSRSLETGAGSAQSLARVDMASGIAAAGRQARILAADLGVSLGVALQLQNINGSADPAKVTPKPRIGFGPGVGRAPDPVYGGVPVLGFGPNSGSPRPVTRDPRFNPEGGPGQVFTDDVPGAGRGGAGGGAKEADEVAEALKRQRQALEDLKVSEQQQIAMMLETDPVQREILRNHEALKGVVGEEREEVEKLIAERMRLEEVKSRIEEIGRAGESAFVGLVTGAHSFRDAISMLIGKLAEMAASAAWDSLWGGIGGGLFSGLFGGGGGSTGDTGIFGLGMPMADGGMVMGPGGPRDDKVAAWLSNGEYVVNASATAQHLPLIEAMNSGASMADLAAIIGGARPAWPAFADGGLFGSINGSAAPSGWGLSGSRAGGGMSGGMGMTRVSVDVRAYFDDREGKMMAEVQRVSQEVAVATTTEGLETFSAHHLPARIAEIDANPRIYG